MLSILSLRCWGIKDDFGRQDLSDDQLQRKRNNVTTQVVMTNKRKKRKSGYDSEDCTGFYFKTFLASTTSEWGRRWRTTTDKRCRLTVTFAGSLSHQTYSRDRILHKSSHCFHSFPCLVFHGMKMKKLPVGLLALHHMVSWRRHAVAWAPWQIVFFEGSVLRSYRQLFSLEHLSLKRRRSNEVRR